MRSSALEHCLRIADCMWKRCPRMGRAPPPSIARSAIERGADLILVAGGDGTINEVVNGMVHSDVPLGILPAGTANVLANELGIGKTMEQAAEVARGNVPKSASRSGCFRPIGWTCRVTFC